MKTTSARHRLPTTYKGLAAQFLPRPIHDEVALANAIEMVNRLAVQNSLNDDQADYLVLLTDLIEAYEESKDSIDLSGITPIESLKFLMDQNEMNASDLGRLLGNRALGSKILNEERELSKQHIRILAERFSVSPALFL